MSHDWPVILDGQTPTGLHLRLRPLHRRDQRELLAVRRRDAEWLRRWDPTTPPTGKPRTEAARNFRSYRRGLEQAAVRGSSVPLLITTGRQIVGQVTANSIILGAFHSCTMGYWVTSRLAGRWVAPTAVAMLGDYLLDPEGRGLHRLQIDIRPENVASLAVVRKLGFREEGRRQDYLHIDGEWRDHISYALVREEIGAGGLQARLSREYQQSLARHTD